MITFAGGQEGINMYLKCLLHGKPTEFIILLLCSEQDQRACIYLEELVIATRSKSFYMQMPVVKT